MGEHEQAAKVSRQHTQYFTKDKKRVPGTTTITGVMDKPALVGWANRLGLEGIDCKKYVDELATIGTLAHYMIECHCKGVKPELGDYTPNQVSLAENSTIKWMMWQDSVGFVPEHNELVLVSEKHRFGGTLDIIGRLTKHDNKRVLVDIKTCKGIFGEHKTQVAGGYKILADEHPEIVGKIDGVIITRVGRSDTEGFEQVPVGAEESAVHQERFLICRALYDSNAKVKKFEKW